MAVKIRLQRHGKKGQPYYHIVVADARSKRDGKYIEKLGSYNPNVNPAVIELSVDGAVKWLQDGAQPTDTARAILSYKGAMLKNHLINGVRKGALTEDQVETKFQAWLADKEGKISAKSDQLAKDEEANAKKQLAAETEANEARAKAILAKNTPEEVVEEAPVAEEVVSEAATDEAPQEEVVAEEVKEEAPVAEAETKVEEVKAEAPVVEEAKEEATPAEETSEEEKAAE